MNTPRRGDVPDLTLLLVDLLRSGAPTSTTAVPQSTFACKNPACDKKVRLTLRPDVLAKVCSETGVVVRCTACDTRVRVAFTITVV